MHTIERAPSIVFKMKDKPCDEKLRASFFFDEFRVLANTRNKKVRTGAGAVSVSPLDPM